MLDTAKELLFYGGAIFGVLGLGSYTYLFPLYYFLILRKLDKHYFQTEATNHPLFPKSWFIRLMIYCSSIVFYKRAMKRSLSDQFFGEDYPRERCGNLQVIMAYYTLITVCCAILFGLAILGFDFIIAPMIGTTPVM